ncbi:hypothetical protein V7S43_008608 [Phytophthora oleae]|uniref:D-isomer specific 2-hydroxyacid dehydrogenase NAD-binding domain-containing protein n=1 Tax=Phytophthora oleae TaxID=2107226 RepID=A0ABD3FKX1_9STRA
MTTRSFTVSTPKNMKVVCALYEGGEAGKQNLNIFGCVENDLGRIDLRVLRHLHPFDVKLHYTDKVRLLADVKKELNVKFHPSVEDMVNECDVMSINCPLHPETENLFDVKLLSKMKKGAYIVKTVISHDKHNKLNTAYSFYNVAPSVLTAS